MQKGKSKISLFTLKLTEMENKRYLFHIEFVGSYTGKRVEPMDAYFKTLKEAEKHKILIDETVLTAYIFDTVTKKIVINFK